MMIRIASVVCVLALGSMTPLAFTAQMQTIAAALSVQTEPEQGIILNVDVEKKTFTLQKADDSRVAISVTDETVFYLDGKRSTMSEALRAGRNATVTHNDRKATRVEVKSTN
ncbi:MAG TPA: hypothetical protein PK400_04355 [Phycisphaerales bacterium]|nr:hypothetical protein [Phycisphaerales bacterium]HRQ74931.1 hypothetical protein [Phycisphaerales bacterium]